MDSRLARFSRCGETLSSDTAFRGIDFKKATLANFGDYSVVVHEFEPNRKANSHYHTFGDIDFFIVTGGEGTLYLAQVEDDQVVEGSQETHAIKEGDFFAIPTYVLHGVETEDSSVTIVNFAPVNHASAIDPNGARIARDVFYPQA